MDAATSLSRNALEAGEADFDAEAEVAFSRAAFVEAYAVLDGPDVVEVLAECDGPFIETILARIIVEAGDGLVNFVDAIATLGDVFVNLVLEIVI